MNRLSQNYSHLNNIEDMDMKEISRENQKQEMIRSMSWKSHKGKTIFEDMPKWYSLTTPFELAITGQAFDHLCNSSLKHEQDTLEVVVKNCKIFAWMSPEGKARLVENI